MISCCKDCQRRHLGCHGHCEEYLQSKKIHNEQQETYRRFRYAGMDLDKRQKVRDLYFSRLSKYKGGRQ